MPFAVEDHEHRLFNVRAHGRRKFSARANCCMQFPDLWCHLPAHPPVIAGQHLHPTGGERDQHAVGDGPWDPPVTVLSVLVGPTGLPVGEPDGVNPGVGQKDRLVRRHTKDLAGCRPELLPERTVEQRRPDP